MWRVNFTIWFGYEGDVAVDLRKLKEFYVMEKLKTIKEGFVGEIKGIIDKARDIAVRSVNFSRVQMYWNIGKRIFEEEQQGKKRAEYGSYLIKRLAP